MLKQAYRVEYSQDCNEVCIIPTPSIGTLEFIELTEFYIEKGYNYWLPADQRCGYLFCKDLDIYYKKNPKKFGSAKI